MLRMSEVSPSNTVVNDYSTLFRTYDARTGRWTSHDPIRQPWESTYSGLAGNPAMLTDWFGLKTSTLASPLAPGTSNSESSHGGMTFGFATDPGLSLQSYIVTPFFAPISVSAPVIGLYIPSPSVTTEGNNPFVMIPRGVYDGFVRDGLNEDLKAIGELPETISGLFDEITSIAQDPERLAALVFEYFDDRPALKTMCILNPALAPTLILADILVPSLIEQICEDATAITGILPLNLIPKLIKEDYYGAGYDYGKGLYTALKYLPWGGLVLKGISILRKYLPKTAGLLRKLVGKKKGKSKELTTQEQKSIRSYERLIREHQQKIDEFEANPTVRPGMEHLPKEDILRQQRARIDHLKKEIQTFEDNIRKIKGEDKE